MKLKQINKYIEGIHPRYFITDTQEILSKREFLYVTLKGIKTYVNKSALDLGAVKPYRFSAEYVFYKGAIYRVLTNWNTEPLVRLRTDGNRRCLALVKDLVRMCK